jgi:hypothetical protein
MDDFANILAIMSIKSVSFFESKNTMKITSTEYGSQFRIKNPSKFKIYH